MFLPTPRECRTLGLPPQTDIFKWLKRKRSEPAVLDHGEIRNWQMQTSFDSYVHTVYIYKHSTPDTKLSSL